MTIAKTSIESLNSLRLPELQSLYAETIGKPTKSPNKTFLIKRIREALAQQASEIQAEEAAIEEMAAKEPTTEPEPTTEIASAPEPAEEPATTETAPIIEEEPEVAAMEPTVADSAEDEASAAETSEDEASETLATEAELAEMEATTEDTATEESTDAGKKLSKMSIQELQARYLEEVGRPTGSSHRRYLVWKIREAQRGRVPVGPRTQRTSSTDAEMKILPLRMEEGLVEQLDEARKRLGLRSRMDLFRRALSHYMAASGETELAAALAAE